MLNFGVRTLTTMTLQRTISLVRPIHRRVLASTSTSLVDGSRQFWSSPVVMAEKNEKALYTDLVKSVAKEVAVTHDTAKKITDGFIQKIKESIEMGKDVGIYKFGTFKAVTQKARGARNPSTNEAISVPEKKSMRFRPSSYFKSSLNKDK